MNNEKQRAKPVVLLLGKLPPPYMGPAIATQIILNSTLNDQFELVHLNTRINESLTGLGKWEFRKSLRSLSLYWKMLRMVFKYKPQLILVPISQTSMGFFKDSWYIMIGWLFGSKVIVQLRGSGFKNWIDYASKLMRFYVKIVLKMTQSVIVLGENLRYLFEDYYAPENIHIVPNGADYIIPPVATNGRTKVQLLYLANLQASKGIEDVVEAMGLLSTVVLNKVQLTIVGHWRDSKTETTCRKIVEEKKLPVTILPPMTGQDKMEMMASADIFIFPPRAPEGHPWVLIEAMAAGLPLIVTDQGAITEWIQEGYNGFVVNTYDPQDIAQKITFLVENETARKKMGQASKTLYDQHLTEQHMVGNIAKSFHAVIG